jgi:hypothetical protein
MKGIWLFLIIVAVWFVLARFILPRFGIRTCISGSCRVHSHSEKEERKEEKESES